MMIHDYCSICGAKRPLILGSVVVEGMMAEEYLMHMCGECIQRGIERSDDDTIIHTKLYALHSTGLYYRVYPYDGLYADLLPTYRPEAFRSN